ncbi:MAG: hypothetical protein H6601_04290 [Flavobacteriales bacterium]|nr:hypothetical protein [Flavobacteriales bacterium]
MQRLVSIDLLAILALLYFSSCSNRVENRPSDSVVSRPIFANLLNDDMNGFEKAVVLRRAIADTFDIGTTSDDLCLNFANIPFQEFVVDSFLLRFGNNTGAGKCGLAGSILAKTMNDNGIEAYTYNYGFAGSRPTHVVVIAQTEENFWTLHDPSYNYSITDTLGEPKDFLKLLQELGQQNHSNISFSGDTVMREYHFKSLEGVRGFVNEDCFTFLESQLNINEDSLLILRPVCHSCSFDSILCPELNLWHNLSQRVKELGFPAQAVYGLLFQINDLWGPNSKALQMEIDQINKIPTLVSESIDQPTISK